ncbi:D-lactate dehydrogenase [Chitinivorax tropicus]|uniref:D-lactate dehydrogenase n=1 Tax=Chitinivorax tropicus TaxID=714531 RepID=A0A840MDJ0_9PROT|nr:2-hydroxyacid dehydrogenase [Chitinivorax tropicus]MBB5017374.1 D-lactate dehydrogenase [Chitinivorax tropicus]
MKIAVFDTHSYDRDALTLANQQFGHELHFFEARLTAQTAGLASGFEVVCPFVNDKLNAETLAQLYQVGVRLIALRAAGYNAIDVPEARRLGMRVVRVPAYSPHAVAEHAFALLLSLVRKTHRAYNRVRDGNFALDGLVGFDLYGKTVGVIGTGRIGQAAIGIARGFGCRVLADDLYPDTALAQAMGFEYVPREVLLAQSDVVSLHLPLTPDSRHLINQDSLHGMKHGAILINTSRGALVDTMALIQALKSGRLGGVGLDVYELEEGVFFQNLSDKPLQDDQLARLLTFPNVLITSHQGFLTREALGNIAQTTLDNVSAYESGKKLENEVS